MPSSVLDARIAIRSLWQSRSFSTLIILILALGIGSTTALFSAVDAVWLRGLPFGAPERLVEIFGQEGERTSMRVPAAILEALRQRSKTIEAITVHAPIRGTIRTPDGTVALVGERVSATFLDVVQVSPIAGRGFRPEDERPGSPAVVLLAHSFWQRYLGGNPKVVGEVVSLSGVPHTVVGVMSPSFRTAFRNPEKQYWTPQASDAVREVERENGYELIARLKPGVTLDEARRELQAIAVTAGDEPWQTQRRRLTLHSLRDEIVRDSARSLQALLAAAVVLLGIMCANVAQLLVARSDRRAREFAVRKALGAGAIQLFRLAFLESLMLSVLGGVAGFVLAGWLLPVIVALAPSEIPRLADATIDMRVVSVSVLLTVITGCVFGLLPAVRLAGQSGLSILKDTLPTRSARRVWARGVLVIVQVATSVALVTVAVLVGRTFLTLLPSEPGFTAESRWSFPLALASDVFADPADRRRKVEEVVERLQTAPGITAVGVASNIPFNSGGGQAPLPVRIAEQQSASASSGIRADIRAISPNFFEILEIPLHSGRAFGASDVHASSPVAIVNRVTARRLVGDGDILGRKIHIGTAADGTAYEIVGVVADTRSSGTSADASHEVYVPFTISRTTLVHLIVRSSLDERTVTRSIRGAIHAVLPDLALRSDQAAISFDKLMYQALARPRFSATLMWAFSFVALLLAAFGVFGLVAYSVADRNREFGIRVALGAMPADVVTQAMKPALLLAASGVAVGLAAGVYASRLLRNQLYGVGALDAETFIIAAALMLTVGGLAAYIPARKAGRIDPLKLLRTS